MNYEELREQLVEQRGRATAIYDDAQHLQTKMQPKAKAAPAAAAQWRATVQPLMARHWLDWQ